MNLLVAFALQNCFEKAAFLLCEDRNYIFDNKFSREEVEEGLFKFLDNHGIDLLSGNGPIVYNTIIPIFLGLPFIKF